MSTEPDTVHFGVADYVILAIMLSVSLGIGLYFAISSRRKSTRVEYLLGGRNMGAVPVCLSLFATYKSAISLMGVPTETYSYGTMNIYILAGVTLAYLAALVTSVPLLYPLRVTSVYEYLTLRFESRAVRVFGSAVGMISSVSYMTVALLSPALALETAVGVPLWLSIILLGSVGTLYTTLGGMKSVIWTDVFQSLVIFAGIFTVLIKASIDAGGASSVYDEVKASGRLQFDNISVDPRTRHTVWNLIIGFFIFYYSTHYTQSSVQRVMSLPAIRDAYKVQIFAVPLNSSFTIIMILTGLVMVAYFQVIACDPLEAGYVKNSNQVVPYFVLHTLRFLPGLSGLYISTIFSGALSTLSSGINSLAANMVEDFLAGPLRSKSEAVMTTVTKLLVCLFGATVIGLAYLMKQFQGPVTQISYSAIAATNGPLLGLFVLGALIPHTNHIGAMSGCVVGVVVNAWLAVGSILYGYRWPILPAGPTDQCQSSNSTGSNNTMDYLSNITTTGAAYDLNATSPPPLHLLPEDRDFTVYDISYVWSPVIGLLFTFIVGIVVSLLTNLCLDRKIRPQARLLFPFCRKFWYGEMDVVDTELRVRNNLLTK